MTARSMSLMTFLVTALVAWACACACACGGAAAPEYVPPPKLPPCPRVIGSVYVPGALQQQQQQQQQPQQQSAASSSRGSAAPSPEASAASSAPPASSASPASPAGVRSAEPAPPLARQAYEPRPRAPQATAPVTSCGDKKSPCPLQRWMRETMAPALAARDAPALAAALDRMAKLSATPGPAWKTMSEAAADAARRGDVAAARTSCRGCHDAFKAEYKKKLRTRPVR